MNHEKVFSLTQALITLTALGPTLADFMHQSMSRTGTSKLDQGLSKHQEMGFNPVTKVLQSNEGT